MPLNIFIGQCGIRLGSYLTDSLFELTEKEPDIIQQYFYQNPTQEKPTSKSILVDTEPREIN